MKLNSRSSFWVHLSDPKSSEKDPAYSLYFPTIFYVPKLDHNGNKKNQP